MLDSGDRLALRYGSPYIELVDTSYIVGSTGYTSTIEYKGKGYFTGKSHTFKATVSSPKLHTPYVIDGLWHTTSTVSSGPGKGKYKKGQTFHDVTTAKEEVTVMTRMLKNMPLVPVKSTLRRPSLSIVKYATKLAMNFHVRTAPERMRAVWLGSLRPSVKKMVA